MIVAANRHLRTRPRKRERYVCRLTCYKRQTVYSVGDVQLVCERLRRDNVHIRRSVDEHVLPASQHHCTTESTEMRSSMTCSVTSHTC